MNGKIILLLMLSLNLVSVAVGFACADQGNSCGSNFSNSVINFFFDVGEPEDVNLTQSTGFNVTNETQEAISDMTQEQSGGGIIAATVDFISSILDSLKMVLGFISLLTPFPFLTLIYSFGLPFLFTMILAIPAFALYTISIMELIRGGSFGS